MSDCMQFPDTWEEFEQAYGFEDKKEIYTNGSRLIQSFRVKQWLDHTAEPERKTGHWEVQPSTGEDRPFIWWKCSECGHVIFSETERDRREFHAFCGRCGAEMTR